jgi:2-iminobutanoate/2-iminopropanoate deaminase
VLKTNNPTTIAPPGGMYSHSVEIPPGARIIYTAGQIGARPDGSIPDNFEEQDDQIWKNTLAILADGGMGPEDIVKLTIYATDPEGRKFSRAHRQKYLNPDHMPATTWIVVSALANPKLVVEMETVAAKVD